MSLFSLPDRLVVKLLERMRAQREGLDPWGVQRNFEALERQAQATAAGTVRTGMIVMWPGANPPEGGWLFLTGGTHNAADYPALYAFLLAEGLISAGATFTLPNMMDRFPIGANGTDIGAFAAGGSDIIARENLPLHAHFMPRVSPATADGHGVGSTFVMSNDAPVDHFGATDNDLLDRTTFAAVNEGQRYRPKFFGVNFVIKT